MMPKLDGNGNGPKTYKINLSGKELHDLISHLESHVIRTENYFDARTYVYLAERLRYEAKQAGWPKAIEPESLRVLQTYVDNCLKIKQK